MDMDKYIGKQVVAFGAGDFGIQFAKKYNNVKLFLDNKVRYGEKITQQDTKIIIVNPDYYFNNIGGKSYIVITMKEWVEVANYLENIGKRFYFDYLPVSLLEYDTIDIGFFEIRSDKFDPIYWLHTFANGKKLVGCYGECHMILYRQLLNTSKKFKDNYIFISMPTINDYNNRYKILIDNLEIWRNCDVVILNENEYINSLRYFELTNKIKIIGITDSLLPDYKRLDGWNLIKMDDLNTIPFDLLIVMSKLHYKEIMQIAIESGIAENKIISYKVLNIPNLDFDAYCKIKNNKISIISNNCWGGILYSTLGLECLSPFKNLFLEDGDYLKCISDLKAYLSEKLIFDCYKMDTHSNLKYPVMKLGDIKIHCNHDSDPEIAKERWDNRIIKVNYDNLLIEMYTKQYKWARKFAQTKHKKKILFVPFDSTLQNAFKLELYPGQTEFYEAVNRSASDTGYMFKLLQILDGNIEVRYEE